MESPALGRPVTLAAFAVSVVVVGVGALLVALGAPFPMAVAGSLVAGLFTLVVVPLAMIARRVGSTTDDPLVLERRIGTGAGRTAAELDALAEWDERRGRLDENDYD